MIHSLNQFTLPNSLQLSTSKANTSACSDNFVGIIKYDKGRFMSFNGKQQFGLQRNADDKSVQIQKRKVLNYNSLPACKNPRIVILLESPHKDEYPPINNTAVSGPAMGNSGNRFNSQCIKVFNNNSNMLKTQLGITNSASKIEYDVFFVNAIQYECSLGYSPIKPEIRDYVFELLWNQQSNSFRDDLVERLNLLHPNLIINACTKYLQINCCNQNAITTGQNCANYPYVNASDHICNWDNDTIIG